MGKFVTDEVRFSYANVFAPKSFEEGDTPKYSITLIIPKKDKKQIARLLAEIEKEKEAFMTSNGLTKLPSKFHIPLRDGDEEKPDDETYADSYFISANSKKKPKIVDADLNPIIDADEFCSGYYGRASFNLHGFDKKGKGIRAELNNIQLLRGNDEDRLSGGGSSPEDDFLD